MRGGVATALAAPAALAWLLVAAPAAAQGGVTATASSSASTSVASSTPAPMTAQQQFQQCLQDSMQQAGDDETVGEIRRRCLRNAGQAAPVPRSRPDVDQVQATTSVIVARTDRETQLWSERLSFMPHRQNYLLPIAYSADVRSTAGDARSLQAAELKYQLSFKLPLLDPVDRHAANVYFAYTGQFWWQAYNGDRSRPFREYNHEPEVFASWQTEQPIGSWTLRTVNAGFVHQSNGRDQLASRSWNRLFADLRFDAPNRWWLALRPWWRLPEKAKPDPTAANGDDNPDIGRYMGSGEVRFGYAGERWRAGMMLRHSLQSDGRGAAQLDVSVPTGFNPLVRWYLQVFDGYGESMIDYNRHVRRIGIGLMLNDWY
jgi:phospholipase A1/A2